MPRLSKTRLSCGRLLTAAVMVVGTMSICTGCSGRSIQADNPVLGSTPPRLRDSVARAQLSDQGTQSASVVDGVTQASFSDGNEQPAIANKDISGIAASVNGTPILVADVLERYTPQLMAAEQQLPTAEFEKLKTKLIKEELPSHIEQAVLVDAAMSKIGPDQREAVEEQLDSYFSEYVVQIQAQMEVSSLVELEAKLQQAGTSLSYLQRSFKNRSLAEQSMGLLMDRQPMVNRSELLAAYEERVDEYTTNERVKWQQVWISYRKHGGKEQALDVLQQAIAALKSGRSFDEVAQQYSDGAMASSGGHWDWTERGSLADESVERQIFELPVGEIGQVIESEQALQIVRVVERQAQRTQPFSEVQEPLIVELKQVKQQAMATEAIAKLQEEAVITTMFDGESE